MAESEARVSGDLLASQPKVQDDLVRIIANQGDPDRLMAEHEPDGKGRCPTCKSLGCTLFAAAIAAVRLRAGGSTA